MEAKELTPEQLYNMGQTGMNIKMLQGTTFLGSQKTKHELTICCNAVTRKIHL